MLLGSNSLMINKKLPFDSVVEYLEGTGTQYINSGLTISDTLRVVGRFKTEDICWLFGGRSDSNIKQFSVYQQASSNMRFGYNNTAVDNTISLGEHEIDFDQNVARADGNTLHTFTAATFSSPSPLYIGTLSINEQGDSATQCLKGRIYYCKIYVAGVLVRDFIPVCKGNVGALYDCRGVGGMNSDGSPRNDGMYYNVGTGDFLYGNDIVPVEYLESSTNTYVDTGIIPDDTYGMEVTGYTTQMNDSAWIGTRNNDNRCFLGYAPNLGFYYGWNTRQDIQYTTGIWSTASMNLYNNRKNMMDGLQVGSITQTLGTQNRAIYLFSLYEEGTPGLRIKKVSITKGLDEVLKLQAIRIGSGSTWEGAMMDTLTRRVYRNQGTGTFGYGNDLKSPLI